MEVGLGMRLGGFGLVRDLGFTYFRGEGTKKWSRILPFHTTRNSNDESKEIS